MSDLAHNHPNHLYHADQHFYQLFRDLQSKLDNSFLFVMGDHGNRFGKLRATPTGTMEDNNPALFVVLPRKLRHNPALRAILESNAKQLISHYDLYATLVEIAQMRGDWNENYRPAQESQHGLSILHKLLPRNCPSLKIPFDYCQCEWNYIDITSDQLADQLVWAAVDKLNQDLADANLTDCEQLTPDADMTKISIKKFEEKPLGTEDNSTATYKLTFVTQPGGGQFSGFIEAKTNKEAGEDKKVIRIISDTFSRLNAEGDQSKCAINQPKVRHYCYCKKTMIGKVWTKTMVGGR